MDDERYRELLTRSALNDLSDVERAELEAEVERRGDAGRDEADRIREVVGSVGLGAPPRQPPTALRERVLAAIDEPGASPEPGDTPTTDPTGAVRRTRLWPWVAVAATLAAIGLGLHSMGLREDLTSTRNELRTAESLAAEADVFRDSLSELVSDVSTLVGSSPVTLSGTSSDVAGRARVFVDVDAGHTLLLVDELPVLPPDQVYQLWAIRGAEPASAGAFRLETEGPAWIELGESSLVAEADLLTVTVEDAPGAPAPTGSPILAGET